VSQRLGLRPQTGPRRARQLLLLGRRWWPGGERTVIGAQTDRVHERGGAWARRDVRRGAPLRLEAAG
jgi:hypothetical protein